MVDIGGGSNNGKIQYWPQGILYPPESLFLPMVKEMHCTFDLDKIASHKSDISCQQIFPNAVILNVVLKYILPINDAGKEAAAINKRIDQCISYISCMVPNVSNVEIESLPTRNVYESNKKYPIRMAMALNRLVKLIKKELVISDFEYIGDPSWYGSLYVTTGLTSLSVSGVDQIDGANFVAVVRKCSQPLLSLAVYDGQQYRDIYQILADQDNNHMTYPNLETLNIYGGNCAEDLNLSETQSSTVPFPKTFCTIAISSSLYTPYSFAKHPYLWTISCSWLRKCLISIHCIVESLEWVRNPNPYHIQST